jgi:hypothetical protein
VEEAVVTRVNLEVHGKDMAELRTAADAELEQLLPGAKWKIVITAEVAERQTDGTIVMWKAEVEAWERTEQ